MKTLLVAVLASTFFLGSASGFAADTAGKPELTKEERMEMRNRADKLTAERATTPAKTSVEPATKAKKHSTKTKKASRTGTKHTQPKT